MIIGGLTKYEISTNEEQVIQAVTFVSLIVGGHQQPFQFGSRKLTIPKGGHNKITWEISSAQVTP